VFIGSLGFYTLSLNYVVRFSTRSIAILKFSPVLNRIIRMPDHAGDEANHINAKHQADLFVQTREKAIGSLAKPAASDELIDWNDEHIAGQAPFSAVTDPIKKEKLMARRLAIRMNSVYHSFAMTIKRADRSCSLTENSHESFRCVFFDFLREVQTLRAMYEDLRSNGPGVNPDGYFRALGATVEQIRINVGGLAAYISHGEPSTVSIILKGLGASSAQVPLTLPSGGSDASGGSHGGNADANTARKRNADDPRPERVCTYCGKNGHTASVCHARKRDEKNHNHPNHHQQHFANNFIHSQQSMASAHGGTPSPAVSLTPEQKRILDALAGLVKQ